jgi:hypothetical protein
MDNGGAFGLNRLAVRAERRTSAKRAKQQSF